MSDRVARGVHWSFWLIVAAALIWNAMGVMNYIMQTNADNVAAYPETHRAIIEGRPAWATGGFAIAVFGGTIGCILLLIRKSTAFYWFVASLLGVIVTMVHTVGVVGATSGFGTFEIVMMVVMPVLMAAFLAWYSQQADSKGWTR